MNILQRIVDRISPKSLEEEKQKTEEYEDRRKRRLVKVRGTIETQAEIDLPEDFAKAFHLLPEGDTPDDGNGRA